MFKPHHRHSVAARHNQSVDIADGEALTFQRLGLPSANNPFHREHRATFRGPYVVGVQLRARPDSCEPNMSFDIDSGAVVCLCSTMSTIEGSTIPAPPKPPRVFLVENDFLIAETVTDQLAELGYTVIGPAYSLAEAIRVAANDHMDAALLDWWLDGVTSEPVADILVGRRIPFTFLTGYAEVTDERYRNIPLLKKPFLMVAYIRACFMINPPR
jgi:CheY-like chemotaxis protein